MCANAKVGRQTVSPGSHLISYGKLGSDYKQWGFGSRNRWGTFAGQYNARIERLHEIYKNFDKVYVEFSEFFEGGAPFHLPSTPFMKIAAVQNENGILILTKPSKDTPIEGYHHRTAVVLDQKRVSEFYTHSKIVEIDYNLLKLAI